LSRWFESRREVRVIGLIRKEAGLAAAATEELLKATEFAVKGKTSEVELSYESQTRINKDADTLRKDIMLELSKGYLEERDRDDLLTLSREVSWIIDYAHELGALLSIDLHKMLKKMQDYSVQMCRMARDCANATVRCISLLADRKTDEALKAADDVERLEEEVDDIYLESRKVLAEMSCDDYKIGHVILLNQFLLAVENVTDRCEYTIDQVRAMIVHLRR
jgi:predicted phosphate transport protein (TIGR00153 family)